MIWEAGFRLPEPTACLPVLYLLWYVDHFDRQPLYIRLLWVDILISMNAPNNDFYLTYPNPLVDSIGLNAPESLNLPSSIFLI